MKGLFIAFEGIDGSGKDTALDRVIPYLYSEKVDKYANVLRTREPTKTSPFGIALAKGLIDGSILTNDKVMELFTLDRIDHSEIIRNHLNENTHVLCSRYDLSTYAYQSLKGFTFEEIYDKSNYRKRPGCLVPDVTFFFELPAEVAISRISAGRTRKEAYETFEILSKVAEKYIDAINFLRNEDGREIVIIDATKSRDEVYAEVMVHLQRVL